MGSIDRSGFVQFETGQLTEKQARGIAAVSYAGEEATVYWHLLDGEAPPHPDGWAMRVPAMT